jgi:hypothetical protein
MPARRIRAQRKVWNPSMGRVRRLIALEAVNGDRQQSRPRKLEEQRSREAPAYRMAVGSRDAGGKHRY